MLSHCNVPSPDPIFTPFSPCPEPRTRAFTVPPDLPQTTLKITNDCQDEQPTVASGGRLQRWMPTHRCKPEPLAPVDPSVHRVPLPLSNSFALALTTKAFFEVGNETLAVFSPQRGRKSASAFFSVFHILQDYPHSTPVCYDFENFCTLILQIFAGFTSKFTEGSSFL